MVYQTGIRHQPFLTCRKQLDFFRSLASEEISGQPWKGSGWQCARVHVFCHPKPVSLWDPTHPSLDSHLSRPDSHILQEWNFKSLPLKSSPQGSWNIITATLLTLQKIWDTKNLLVVALITTGTANSKRDWACTYRPGKNLLEHSQLHSHDNSYVLDGWPLISAIHLCIQNSGGVVSPFFISTSVVSGDIEGLPHVWRQSGLYSWFWLWNEAFPMSLLTCRKILEVVDTLVPLSDSMTKLLYFVIDF